MSMLLDKIWAKAFQCKKAVEKRFWPSSSSNVEYNKHLWDFYARNWSQRIGLEDKDLKQDDVKLLGDEWGQKKDVEEVLHSFIYPYIGKDSIVGEIGTGGGRIASQVAPRVKRFYCFDISKEMLRRVQKTLEGQEHVRYELLTGAKLPSRLNEEFDFIYSFDVFPHLDLHTIWQYMESMHRLLKRGGKAFLHTSNITAPDGWERFSTQKNYTVEGHYFISPEIVRFLAEKAGFKMIKESRLMSSNFYYNRDYLVVLEK
jgi:SAM-dependent methyltransferase